MTIPELLEQLWNYFKGDKIGRIEVGIVTGLFGVFVASLFKKRRLKLAIRQELQIMMESYNQQFSNANKKYLIGKITTEPTYRVIILTSQKRTVIGNLNDDISYLNKRTIENLIHFNDLAELVDDAIRVIRDDIFFVPYHREEN